MPQDPAHLQWDHFDNWKGQFARLQVARCSLIHVLANNPLQE